MLDLNPREPQRPLVWSEVVERLQATLLTLAPELPMYLVGGAVRDAYWHRPHKDLDVIVPHDPVRLARRLADAWQGDVFVLDAERGVARVLLLAAGERVQVDITRYRGDSLLDDLLGRDFTLNAMAVDLHGDLGLLIDPLNGESDAQARILRRCTARSLADDAIRGMRAVRQSVAFQLHIDPATLADVRATAPALQQTSPERVRDELFALLSLDRASLGLRLLERLGLLKYVLPDVEPLVSYQAAGPEVRSVWQEALMAVERLVGIQTAISPRRTDHSAAVFDLGMLTIQLDRYRSQLNAHLDETHANERSHSALMRLGMVLAYLGVPHAPEAAFAWSAQRAEAVADAWRLSSPEKRCLVAMIALMPAALTFDATAALALHRYWYGQESYGVDALLLANAAYLARQTIHLQHAAWLAQVERTRTMLAAYYEAYDTLVRPPVLIDGHGLMARLGIPAGRLVGQLLEAIREAQVTGEVQTQADAERLARERLLGA